MPAGRWARRRRFATTQARSGRSRPPTRWPSTCSTPSAPSRPRAQRWWTRSRAAPRRAAAGRRGDERGQSRDRPAHVDRHPRRVWRRARGSHPASYLDPAHSPPDQGWSRGHLGSGPAGGQQHDSHRPPRHDEPPRRRDPRLRPGGCGRHRRHAGARDPLPRVSRLRARRGSAAMSALVVLTVISLVGVAALFVALALFLRGIALELEAIGGPATRFSSPVNYLSKIRLGLRAIERETDALVPHVTRLNSGFGAVRDGVRQIDANLAGLINAVARQERS